MTAPKTYRGATVARNHRSPKGTGHTYYNQQGWTAKLRGYGILGYFPNLATLKRDIDFILKNGTGRVAKALRTRARRA